MPRRRNADASPRLPAAARPSEEQRRDPSYHSTEEQRPYMQDLGDGEYLCRLCNVIALSHHIASKAHWKRCHEEWRTGDPKCWYPERPSGGAAPAAAKAPGGAAPAAAKAPGSIPAVAQPSGNDRWDPAYHAREEARPYMQDLGGGEYFCRLCDVTALSEHIAGNLCCHEDWRIADPTN